MFKKITASVLLVFTFNISFASLISLRTSLETNYNNSLKVSKAIYDDIQTKLQIEKEKISTWDYKILAYLTWTSIDYLFDKNKTNYKNLIKKITASKYDIVSKLDVLENNFNNSFISTWEYENGLTDISSLISWYNIETKKDIALYKKNTLDAINVYTWDIVTKMKKLNTEIQTYKEFENKLKDLNNTYNILKDKNNKLESIIWVSKELLDKKSQDIKNYVNDYFSWYIQKQYQDLLDKDINMSYFKTGFVNKKEIILWFISDKLTNIISSITDTYYPDINYQNIKKQVESINKISVNDVIKNSNTIKDNIQKLEQTIKINIEKVSEKLKKFNNSTKKSNILNILKQDIVNGLKKTLSTIENDLNTTFKNWKDFIKTQKNKEQQIMDNLLVYYNKEMISWDIQRLKDFETVLKEYKNIVILPENIEKIRRYKLAIEKKIEDIKYKNIVSKLNNIKQTIKNLKIWDNKKIIDQIKNELKDVSTYKEFSNQVNDIKLKLQLQENLDKLYKVWAIRYYYQYGDLSDTVSNILSKYYEKYKKLWKKDIFDKKINSAFDKLDILISSLSNDKRSYYVIMIYNGLLKFKNNNK